MSSSGGAAGLTLTVARTGGPGGGGGGLLLGRWCRRGRPADRWTARGCKQAAAGVPLNMLPPALPHTTSPPSTAFILEPSLNPGLEAQAAARICRLGQTHPTRVVRLLAQDTVERPLLEVQRRKVERGEDGGSATLADVDAGVILNVWEAIK